MTTPIVQIPNPLSADGEGVPPSPYDSTAELQAAIDQAGKAPFVLPPRDYTISRPVVVRSDTHLAGSGNGTSITFGPGFIGGEVFRLQDETIKNVSISDITVSGTAPGVAAIRQASQNVLNCSFSRLRLDMAYGLILDSYTQKCRISDIYSVGMLEQLLCLAGNVNMVTNLDHEGGAGTSTEPFVLLKSGIGGLANGNVFRDILLEGTGAASKTPFVVDGAHGVVVDNLWIEVLVCNGYFARFSNIDVAAHVRHPYNILQSGSRIKVESTRELTWGVADTNAQILTPTDVFDVDATSHVTIVDLYNRNNADAFPLTSNITVASSFSNLAHVDAKPGVMPAVQVICHGRNRLVNPSFDNSDLTGWGIDGGSPVVEYVASPVGPGKALHLTFPVADVWRVYQYVPISAAQVGIPVTFTALAIAIAGGANSSAIAQVQGAGVGPALYSQAHVGKGWQIVSQTVIPQAAGNLEVGVTAYLATEIMIDECSLALGNVGIPNCS